MASHIALILLINLVFYLKTLEFEYVSDDIPSSQRPKEKAWWKHVFWTIEGKLKTRPKYDHAITLCIHALVCVGIYVGFGGTDISFLAAVLFALNPVNNQASVWISGRGYALSALGMVWALALPGEAAAFALLLATYSNAGYFMPVALAGSNHPHLLLFMPFIWAIWFKNFKANVTHKYKMETFAEDRKLEPFKLILATKTFGFYLLHALVPIKNTFYHSFLESLAGSKKHRARTLCRFFWAGLAALVFMAAYMLTHKWNQVCFGMLWWCVGIAPFLNIMRMQQEISERYCYLPNVGLMIVLASFLSKVYPFSPVVYGVLAGGFVMMYATKMWFYMETFRSDFWLVEYATFNSPESWFAWNARAHHRWINKSHQEALVFWVIALQKSPKEFKLLMNIAACLALMGPQRHAEAMGFVAQAEQNIPGGQEEMGRDIITKFRAGTITFLI